MNIAMQANKAVIVAGALVLAAAFAAPTFAATTSRINRGTLLIPPGTHRAARPANGTCQPGLNWPITGNLVPDGDFNTAAGPNGSFTYYGPNTVSTTKWHVMKHRNVDLVDGTYWDTPPGQNGGYVCTVDLDGSPGVGGIYERFATPINTVYDVRFLLAGSAPAPGLNTAKVTAGNLSAVASYTTSSTHSVYTDSYDPYCYTFTSTSSMTKLQFKSTDHPQSDSDGAVITEITVTPSDGCTPSNQNRSQHKLFGF
jgi:hypothetical protein